MNKKQRLILAIFIPVIILFFTLMITANLGYTGETRELPENNPESELGKLFGVDIAIHLKGNPFDWENTWYVWTLYLIFICIFEYKLFADKKIKGTKDNEK